jgi:hypothetical protein
VVESVSINLIHSVLPAQNSRGNSKRTDHLPQRGQVQANSPKQALRCQRNATSVIHKFPRFKACTQPKFTQNTRTVITPDRFPIRKGQSKTRTLLLRLAPAAQRRRPQSSETLLGCSCSICWRCHRLDITRGHIAAENLTARFHLAFASRIG